MEDRLLVEALRSRDPIAMGSVYDDYAGRLYDYCWFHLRNGDAAQVAFRDTLMCAESHVGRLRTPARFGAWLYALARVECRRRRPGGPVQPDLPIARHDQDDVDLRLMAWRAVTGLPSLSRELLDLRHRRGLGDTDIALVVGLRPREVGDQFRQAGVLLEAALIAEILAHDGLERCARRAVILRSRTGEVDADLREALVRHSLECTACARHLPDNIAPGKVYDLLPRAPLPPALRAQVMNCFTDPELAGYRLFAAARVSRFGAQGFPLQPGAGRVAAFRRVPGDPPRTARGWARALTAMAGALIAAATATALCGYFGRESSHDSHGVVAAPPGPRSPRPSPAPPGRPGGARPVSAALPLGTAATARPVVALGEAPQDFLWAPGTPDLGVSPAYLRLPPGGTGTLTLTAGDDPVRWRVTGDGPLRLAPAAGALGPTAAQVVWVHAPAGGPGSEVLTFWPGGRQVQVTWSGRPPSPPSSPHPPSTPTPPPPPPSSTPTPTPTPPPPTPTPTPTTPSPSEPPPSAPAPAPPEHSDPPPPQPSSSGPAT